MAAGNRNLTIQKTIPKTVRRYRLGGAGFRKAGIHSRRVPAGEGMGEPGAPPVSLFFHLGVPARVQLPEPGGDRIEIG